MWFHELSPYRCAVLRKNFPHSTVVEGDIRSLTADDVPNGQAHFFAGIGGFGLACEWAEWCYNPDLDTTAKICYLPENGQSYTQEEIAMAGKLKKLTIEQAAECVRMYESGLSMAPIAEYFHVSRNAMWDLLRRRTKMRPQQRHGSENHFYRDGQRADDHAQNMVEYAIRSGVLSRAARCEKCNGEGKFQDGRSSVQAHHDDYNKPLIVRWLCQKCHHGWHKHNRPRRREVRNTEAVDPQIWTGGFP